MAGIMLAGYVLFVNMVAFVHYSIAVIFAVYLFPILLSLFYNSRRMTLLTSFFVLASYAVLAAVYLPTKNPEFVRHSDIDMVAMPALIIITTVVGMRILDIYSELIDKIIDQTIKKIILEREAKEDSLTRLFNHAVFYESLELAIASHNETPAPFCIIVMDIDDFKIVNDTYGHAFGDIVLLTFASIIRSNLGENDMAFRYGGEEFSIIAFRPLNQTMLLAENIRTDFAAAKLDDHPDANFSVSIGVCMYSKGFSGKRDFFASADRALYAAKRHGKNRTVAADDDILEGYGVT